MESQIEAIYRELDIQMERITQVQRQLADLRTTVRQILAERSGLTH